MVPAALRIFLRKRKSGRQKQSLLRQIRMWKWRVLTEAVIMVPVADGIHKAEELIRRAVSGTVPVYHHEGGTSEAEAEGDKSIGRTIYKHLMNGVSHMLPFVIGGGILIALAFLLDDYSIDPSNFGKNTPLAAYLKTIGEQAFGMMLPILAGFIA